MHIFEVVPLLNLPKSQPQKLTYFGLEVLKFGALVEVSVGRKNIEAMVINSRPIANKIEIKNLNYSLKPIKKIINLNPIVTEKQWILIQWLAEYYYLPLSGILRFALPNKNLLKKLNLQNEIEIKNSEKKNSSEIVYLFDENWNIVLEKIKKYLLNGKQIFILTPNHVRAEIYLERLKRFSNDLVFFDRQLSIKKLQSLYGDISSGKKKIIVGRRNAIFAPFDDLGLVVVDEEENPSLETWETKIHFNAKDSSFALAKMFSAELVLSSSGFSVLGSGLVKGGLLRAVDLPQTNLKNVVTIENKNIGEFAPEVKMEIEKTLDKKKPVLVFVNRKGFSSALVCGDCGYVAKCPNCDVALVYHQDFSENKMRCHHCGFERSAGNICPKCRGHLVKFIGAGTQKLSKILKGLYPPAEIAEFDSDSLKTLKNENELFEKFNNREVDILVATELFLKFLDKLKQPLGLSVIFSTDQFLVFPDFKNEERLFQTIVKLSMASEKLALQSLDSKSEFFSNIRQLDKFYENELELRTGYGYPPLADIVKIEISHKNLSQLERLADHLYKILKKNSDKFLGADGYVLMSPIPGFIPKINNFYIKEIIWKIKKKNPGLTPLDVVRKRNKILALMPDDAGIEINPANLV